MQSRSKPRTAITLGRSRQLRRDATEAEKRLWGALRGRRLIGAKFRRQFVLGSFISDFCAPSLKLVIEIDGGQHVERSTYDQARTDAMKRLGYRVIRFWNDDVLRNTDEVLEAILAEIGATAPSPRRHGA